MKCTSSEANKLLKTLESKRDSIIRIEEKAANFTLAAGEKIEEIRPAYDFKKTQNEISEMNKKIRTVKHAINVFNTSHTVPGFEDMTIDQVLVYLPQLYDRVGRLREMTEALPRERVASYRSKIVEYKIANYDVKEVESEYDRARRELNALQLALDAVNSSETIEIDVTLD